MKIGNKSAKSLFLFDFVLPILLPIIVKSDYYRLNDVNQKYIYTFPDKLTSYFAIYLCLCNLIKI